MALALLKSYQWKLNDNSSPLKIVTSPRTMDPQLKLKNTLKAFPLFPWQVMGSSNGTAAGMDGVDRWSTTADIVRGYVSGSRSWIVLYQSATGIHWLWHAYAASGTLGNDNGECYVSYAGFTGGSTTARPTATDEILIGGASGSALTGMFNTGGNGASMALTELHVWHTSDGLQTSVIGYSNAAQFFGFGGFCWLNVYMGRVHGRTPSYWPHPDYYNVTGYGYGVSASTLCGFDNGLQSGWVMSPAGAAARAYLTTEMADFGGGMTGIVDNETANGISSVPGIYPYGVLCKDTSLRIKLGCWPDVWARSNNLGNNAASTPNGYGNFIDADKNAIIMDRQVRPWDPSVSAPTV